MEVEVNLYNVSKDVMLSHGFRANPREGHLARARRIVGFLVKFKHASLRYRTGCPDYTDLAPQTYDWDSTPCLVTRQWWH